VQKVPYMLVIGEKEVENKEVSVRKRGTGDLGAQPLEQFIEEVTKESQMPQSSDKV
jgi:threonyl-tRNA synthetase